MLWRLGLALTILGSERCSDAAILSAVSLVAVAVIATTAAAGKTALPDPVPCEKV